MAIEIINFNQLIQRQSLDRFPNTLFPTNYYYIVFCIIVFLYTIQKRDKKSSSRFMDILSSTQSISILQNVCKNPALSLTRDRLSCNRLSVRLDEMALKSGLNFSDVKSRVKCSSVLGKH
ncbi:hypothetical protein DFA_00165 [Cavenderia fasciculata]|uniref:Uncharacterized protein n=1 Tax=Cavenderia fasciculata TaxID=261658 RepID=F4PXS7_CACFS|nr:uncharacterized protein DFA_00165 [Cavenderia fasciculata]EGG19587.1 hypothetical protein DFA_00165 [Cavenderia fasciculata]|eukprot:XP_004357881.1 hypothetical protein DFA_00165 [Cavenderia fasciculata]